MWGATFTDKLNKNKSFQNTFKKDGTGDDTIKAIVKTINTSSHSKFVKDCVETLSKDNPSDLEFCRRLFEVACRNVKYLADTPGHEVIFTPLLLMKMGQGDCKKFTVYIGSILKAKGIDCVVKVVNYEEGKDWEHVYIISRIIAGGYLTLDPVNHCRYNSEVKYNKARLNYLDGTYSPIMNGNKISIMGNLGTESIPAFLQGVSDSANSLMGDIENISGTGDGQKFSSVGLAGLQEAYVNGNENDSIGKRSAAQKKAAKEKRGKFFKKAKKLGFGPVRVAFLGIIRMAGALSHTPLKINLATKLAILWKKDNGAEITKLWEKFGGKREALRSALAKAANTTINGTNEGMDISGIGVVTVAAAAGLITAAAPILKGVFDLMKKNKVIEPAEADILEHQTETVADAAKTADGAIKQDVAEAMKVSPVVTEAKVDDGGGNVATQKEIVKEAAKEEKTDGDGSQDETKNNNPDNLPATKDQFASPKSIGGSIYLPTVWVRIILFVMLFSQMFSVNPTALKFISSIAILGLIITTIHLLTSKKNNHEI